MHRCTSLPFEKDFYPELKNLKSENDTKFISPIVSFFVLNTKNTFHMIYNKAGLRISKMERDSIKTYKVIAV